MLMLGKGVVNDNPSDKWLAFFLLLCILYIAPWMIGFAGWYDNQPYRDIMFYVPFQHLFLIGPVVFFYVQSLLNPSFKFKGRHWWHLVPAILYLLFSIIMVVTDKIVLKRYYFLADGVDPDFDKWYQYAGFVSMAGYFIISLRYYNVYRRIIVQIVSYADTVLFRWVKNFLLSFLLMLLAQVLFYILSALFPKLNGYIGSWWYFLSFALIFYYIAITGYSNAIQTRVSFHIEHLLTYKPALLLHYQSPWFLQNKELETEDAEFIEISNSSPKTALDKGFPLEDWKDKITSLFTTNKLFENPELSLTDLSARLQTNPSVLSKIINQGFGQNFNDFVNQYRVEAVKEKLLAGEHLVQTLPGIAYDCGFNSKATFNRAFKKAIGTSPGEFAQKP
jgi:AraC-like DNA-binding protein